jgi:hypothetical protein
MHSPEPTPDDDDEDEEDADVTDDVDGAVIAEAKDTEGLLVSS